MGDRIRLRMKVKDTVTGYVGIVTSVCEYAFREEKSYCVEGVGPDGKAFEHWHNPGRLEEVTG